MKANEITMDIAETILGMYFERMNIIINDDKTAGDIMDTFMIAVRLHGDKELTDKEVREICKDAVDAVIVPNKEEEKMKDETTTTTATATATTEADVGFIGRMFQMIIAGAASVWRELIDNKRLVLGVGSYYFALGRTTDGSYGLQVVFGSKIMTLSFKSVKDMLMKAWDLIKQTWAKVKARSV